MKRFVFVLLTFIILGCFITYSFADSNDYSKLNDDELLSIYQDVKKELIVRGVIKINQLPSGLYEAGVDFPAGTYKIKVMEATDERYDPKILIFVDKSSVDKPAFNAIASEYLRLGEEYVVNLENGNILRIEDMVASIEKFVPLEF